VTSEGDIVTTADLDRLPLGTAVVLEPDPPRYLAPTGALLRMPEGWRSADDDGAVRNPTLPGRFRVLFVGAHDDAATAAVEPDDRCRCGHVAANHERVAGRCRRRSCGCTAVRWRPVAPRGRNAARPRETGRV